MDIAARLLEGVLLESNKHSKTHVCSTGFGTEHNPIRVKSTTVTIQEFWLQTKNSVDEKVTRHNAEVNARQGHHIAMIIAI